MSTTNLEKTIQHFTDYLLQKGRKTSTIKRYTYDIKHFLSWLETTDPTIDEDIWESLNKRNFKDFFHYLKEERHYSDKTIHRIYNALNRIYESLDLPSPIEGVIQINQPDRSLRDKDFISSKEEKRLKEVVSSLAELTDKQKATRPMLLERNLSIIILLLDYGLSLQELVSLQMKHVHFEINMLSIPQDSQINRTIHLKEEDKLHLYQYYKTIPEPVRPKYHSSDPLFVAFDFTRGTYHWSYDDDAPKFLTEISVQKMIRLEVKRANLRKGISAQHFRNTFILSKIKQKNKLEQILQQIGFKSHLSLKRYYDYYRQYQLNTD
ncbi:phage integrase N-terminal SAM-like domain-containing protein [Bacillus cereus group sp. N28]|uniref:Integrase n=1 Tax=Bacillus mycoides TaxID=1405 RepID=A0A1S9SZ95_BACMY|nr:MULTISPECIES: site-specific integrase [Bacillus cereus group]MBJ7961100.1 phage integrase N-terminal SAM-like domain-containing protein [Bacillus cereus group sp. N28]OOR03074.1 integrase [Bacillus mycoides]